MRPQERLQFAHQRGQRHARHVGGDEQQPAHRRRDHAERQVVDHDHREVHRVDAELQRHRRQDRHQHHHARQRLDEDAEQQQEDVDDDQEDQRREVLRDHPFGQQLRQPFDRQHPGERRRHADDDEHRRGEQRRARQDGGQRLPLQRAVHPLAAHQRVEHRHHRRLGRREPAGAHAAEDQHRQHQRRQRLEAGDGDLAPARTRFVAAVVAFHRNAPVDGAHADRDQQARQQAGDEEGADRDAFVLQRVDDHDDRRRDDRPDDRRGGGQRGGVGAVVAGLVHHADHHRARTRGVGQRRARDAREERQPDHVGVAQAAALVADELAREAQQHLGQRAAAHQLGGEDEERHRHQRKAVDAGEGFLQQHEQRIVGAEQQRGQRRQPEREGHRHAERQVGAGAQQQDQAGAHSEALALASKCSSEANVRVAR